jgi:predicted secreted protein
MILLREKPLLLGMVLFVLLGSSSVISVEAASTWSQTYGGAEHDVAYSLVATSDGGYALAGYTQSFGAGGTDFWLVKIDAFGNMQWNRTYGGTASEVARSLVVTSDGGYAIAGIWNWTAPFMPGDEDFWLVKTDSNGVMEWNRTYGGPGKDEAYSLVATSDGGYALAGGNLLVKTDSFGNMQWNKPCGKGTAESLVATSDGGYALAGGSLLVKTDSLGNVMWNRTYGEGSILSLVAAPDGGYALAGDTESFGAGGADFWLVKTNENGFIPEYSSWLIPALVLTSTAIILINKKRLLNKRSQKP